MGAWSQLYGHTSCAALQKDPVFDLLMWFNDTINVIISFGKGILQVIYSVLNGASFPQPYPTSESELRFTYPHMAYFVLGP